MRKTAVGGGSGLSNRMPTDKLIIALGEAVAASWGNRVGRRRLS
jgi:hypothetical protein